MRRSRRDDEFTVLVAARLPALRRVAYLLCERVDDEATRRRFTAIYDAYRTRVQAYVAGQAGQRMADQVVSETFAGAWRRLGDVPGPALPWLLGVNPVYWAWHDPAVVSADLAALRRHLLNPIPASRQPEPAELAFFSSALSLMGELLRPAVRASLLRLMADVTRQPWNGATSSDLGNVTDRAGHRGVVIGQDYNEAGPDSLIVYIFDPGTGALLGEEYGKCADPVSSARAASQHCYPDSYAQVFQIKAVHSIPWSAH